MELLKYLGACLMAELVFLISYFLGYVVSLLTEVILAGIRISIGAPAMKEIVKGFLAGVIGFTLALFVAKWVFSLSGIVPGYSLWIVLLLPIIGELLDMKRRSDLSNKPGCFRLENLHGAMKTPIQKSIYEIYRTNFAQIYPNISEDDLFKLSYQETNAALKRMNIGLILSLGVALPLSTKFMNR